MIRRLVAEAPDEPTYCEFKEKLSYATKKEKAELVKDVSSFANADLEALGGYGYIVFGVSDDGKVVGIGSVSGDPPSEARQIVNDKLDRPVVFEYVTCEVDDKAGGKKRVAAIVVPDSRRRPHVATNEIKERLTNKDKFWLRKGEIWVRKTGGRVLATAEDLDSIYEGKLRKLVDDQVRPLQERLERLEEDLREQRSAVPELSFGFFVDNTEVPSPEGEPYPVLDNVIRVENVHNEIKEAKQSIGKGYQAGRIDHAYVGAYSSYLEKLEVWLRKLEDLLVIDFVLSNNGRVPAEDVEVTLRVPAGLQTRSELPFKPQRPHSYFPPTRISHIPLSKHNHPDVLIGPELSPADASGAVHATWEVGKLYHGRPLWTRQEEEYEVGGLLISASSYSQLLSRASEEVHLHYAVHAANVPAALRGALVLR